MPAGALQGTERFLPLEGLRGILAWWVVFSHLIPRTFAAESLSPLVKFFAGTYAVNVFVILSGFVITHLLVTQRQTYATFITRRFFRIYPVFMFAIGLQLLIHYFVYPNKGIPGTDLWAHLLTHVTMLHGAVPNEILPMAARSILSPAWSISLEWQFYLVAPLILGAIWRRSWWLIILLVIVALIAKGSRIEFLDLRLTFDNEAFLPLKAEYFAVGIASRLLLDKIPALTVRDVCFAAGATYMVTAGNLPFALWALALGSLRCEALARPLQARWLTTTGAASYSVYLLHLVVISALLPGIYHAMGGRVSLGWPLFLVATIVLVPAIAVLSHATYRWIERPFIKLGRDLTAPVLRTAPAE